MGEILLLGFGTTNQSVLQYLAKKHIDNVVVVSDQIKKEDLQLINDYNYQYYQQQDYLALKKTPQVIIKSPGVFLDNIILQTFSDVLVINDIEIAYQAIKNTDIKIIGITGTNGKTSTTLLLNQVLNQAGYHAYVCGNIGRSPLDVLLTTNKIDFLVMELSSFQLLNINEFSCDIALILNIVPDHLNYHYSFEHYLHAKLNIIKNLTRTKLIVSGYLALDAYDNVNYITNLSNNYHNSISPLNVSIIKKVLTYLKIDLQYLEDILKNHQFVLAHRLEYVNNINGVNYINDSKATNLAATINALQQLDNIYLLVGGSSKNEDMSLLANYLDNVKQVICYGENKLDFSFIPGIIIVNDLNQAVAICSKITKPGDNVLLSPASASFDQFNNYQQRGEYFKQLVNKLALKGVK